MSDNSTKFTYFLAGASVGALVALLFAPKSGRELRGDISDATRRSIDYTQENARALTEKASDVYTTGREKASSIYATGREKASDLYAAGREKTQSLIETGRGAVGEQRARVAAAIEAGKQAYREKKSEALALDGSQAAENEGGA
jgi:gas vesicle protein